MITIYVLKLVVEFKEKILKDILISDDTIPIYQAKTPKFCKTNNFFGNNIIKKNIKFLLKRNLKIMFQYVHQVFLCTNLFFGLSLWQHFQT